jgi:UDP:flavonoid glycosyltransferase YjiC (YdhE family)
VSNKSLDGQAERYHSDLSERLSNAKRLERVGAAILVEPTIVRGWKEVRPDELRRAVAAALSDPRYGHNARQAGKSLASYGGGIRAADHIEALGKQGSAQNFE